MYHGRPAGLGHFRRRRVDGRRPLSSFVAEPYPRTYNREHPEVGTARARTGLVVFQGSGRAASEAA